MVHFGVLHYCLASSKTLAYLGWRVSIVFRTPFPSPKVARIGTEVLYYQTESKRAFPGRSLLPIVDLGSPEATHVAQRASMWRPVLLVHVESDEGAGFGDFSFCAVGRRARRCPVGPGDEKGSGPLCRRWSKCWEDRDWRVRKTLVWRAILWSSPERVAHLQSLFEVVVHLLRWWQTRLKRSDQYLLMSG